jgi:hypothetical protein
MIRHLCSAAGSCLNHIAYWSNHNEGVIALVGLILGVPGVIYIGWSIRTYVEQRKREDAKLEQAQWKGIYRILKEVTYHASVRQASSAHNPVARQAASVGVDVNGAYKRATEGLVSTIGSLVMELMLIPECDETQRLVDFFYGKYRSIESKASPDFMRGLQEMNTMVLQKAGGKPFAIPPWQRGESASAADRRR